MSQAAIKAVETLSPLQVQLRSAIRLHDEALATESAHQVDELGPIERLIAELVAELAALERGRGEVLERVSQSPENAPSKHDLESINELDAAMTLMRSRLDGARTRRALVNRQQVNISQRRLAAAKSRDVLAEQCAYQDFLEQVRGEQLELQRRLVLLEAMIAGARMFVANNGAKAADPGVTSQAFNELSSFLTWEVPAIALVKQEDAERYRKYLERKRHDATASYGDVKNV
jgi:hypothetical protein